MAIPRLGPFSPRRLIPLVLLTVVVIIYHSASSHSPNLDFTSSFLRTRAPVDPLSSHVLAGNLRSTVVPEGTFIETSAFDLPSLVRDRYRGGSGIGGEGIDGLRIAVLEHAGFHEEVVGAVLKTLLDVGANFTLYRDSFRWGYAEILASGMNYTTPPTPFSDGSYARDVTAGLIDITIHISCDHAFWNWPRNKGAYDAMKSNPNMEVVCMLHELENLKDEERISWEKAMQETRLTYMTLSKHVKRFLRGEVLKWADRFHETKWGNVQVEEFVPIFPIDSTALPDSETTEVAQYFPKSPANPPARLAILGNIQTWRRNYNPIIKDLHQAIEANPQVWGYLPLSTTTPNATYQSSDDISKPPVSLHFIGNLAPTSQLEIPDSMRDMVHIHSGLDYTDFYRLLGSMDLVLPAFIGWTYLEKKLSSAIPAGIVSRVPILGSELLLNAYQFLREPSIILHQPGMSEIEAVSLLRRGLDPNVPLITSGSGPGSHSDVDFQNPLIPSLSSAPTLNEGGWGAIEDAHEPDSQVPFSGGSGEDGEDGGITWRAGKKVGGTDVEWETYHERLYDTNAEMMLDLFARLGKKIKARRETTQ